MVERGAGWFGMDKRESVELEGRKERIRVLYPRDGVWPAGMDWEPHRLLLAKELLQIRNDAVHLHRQTRRVFELPPSSNSPRCLSRSSPLSQVPSPGPPCSPLHQNQTYSLSHHQHSTKPTSYPISIHLSTVLVAS